MLHLRRVDKDLQVWSENSLGGEFHALTLTEKDAREDQFLCLIDGDYFVSNIIFGHDAQGTSYPWVNDKRVERIYDIEELDGMWII